MEEYDNTIPYHIWDANGGRRNRISRYKSFLGLKEDFKITEENLDEYGVSYISCMYNRTPAQVKAELLGQRWSDFEENEGE